MKSVCGSNFPAIRDYIFHESTTSLCPQCMNTVAAKVVFRDEQVFLLKYCAQHGEQWELLEESALYHKQKRLYDKPGTKMKIHTSVNRGCPLDCGICPQHDQHACIGLIEVTTRCDLRCPLCYAGAGQGEDLTLDAIEGMMDFYLEAEGGQAEILQISGGEPTVHPQIIEIIRLAKSKPFKYVMLNTNGLRLAEDKAFVEALSEFRGGFEIYLQFDGFKEETYLHLRGRHLLDQKRQALDNLAAAKIPSTLVTTISGAVNEDEIGPVFMFGLKQPYVRGINFQPQGFFGRRPDVNPGRRVTLSGVLQRLEKQSNRMLKTSDFIPLPCNVERVAITFLYRSGKGNFIPITRDARITEYLHLIDNTFAFTIEDALKNAGRSLTDIQASVDCCKFISDFRHIIPFNFFAKSKQQKMEYIDENTFRISVSAFIDAYNFDLKSMQKECVHVITPDLRKIPFSAYNMIHRGITV